MFIIDYYLGSVSGVQSHLIENTGLQYQGLSYVVFQMTICLVTKMKGNYFS